MNKIFPATAALLIFSSILQAQTPVQDTATALDELVLTANKYPKKQSETGKVVTVITRQQLDKSAGRTLSEVLNTVAGSTIIGANNNLGTNITVSLRGASAGNVLILIDGIPANDPSVITNYFDLNLLPVDQIERIEILKGGQSTLYGSDAVAGVINIISKKAGAKKFSVAGTLAGGSYNTLKQDINVNGRNKLISYSAGYTHLSSDGFSTATDANNTGGFDDDGINQHTLNARVGIQLSKNVQASFFTTYSQYKTDLDASAFTDEKDYSVKNDNVQAGLGLVWTHKRGSLHYNLSMNYVERDYADDSIFKSSPFVDWSRSRYIGRSYFTEVYNSWSWKNLELLAGIDYRLNNTDQFYLSQSPASPPWSPEPSIYFTGFNGREMKQVSPYASFIYKNNHGLNIELGGRLNDHSEYGSNFTYTFNPSYTINKKLKVFGNLYSAFKAPTLYQLFDPSAGNAALAPEKSIVGEVGAQVFASAAFNVRVVGFYRHAKNAIQYITTDPVNYISQYTNVSKQDNYGAELEAAYKQGRFDITANYTYTDGKTESAYDGTGAAIGKDTSYFNLYRIPKHAINLSVGMRATKALYVQAQLRSISKREEFIYGDIPETLKGYTTINLYGEYRFSGLFKAFVDLKNITNQEYVEIRGYNSRKFNFMTGIRFQL